MWARSCLRVMLPGHRRPRKSGQCLQFLLSASPRSSWWRLCTWLLLTIKPRYDGVLDHGCGGADIWRCSLGRGLRRLLVRSKWASTRPSRCIKGSGVKGDVSLFVYLQIPKGQKEDDDAASLGPDHPTRPHSNFTRRRFAHSGLNARP
jgi:hypothetical protein